MNFCKQTNLQNYTIIRYKRQGIFLTLIINFI